MPSVAIISHFLFIPKISKPSLLKSSLLRWPTRWPKFSDCYFRQGPAARAPAYYEPRSRAYATCSLLLPRRVVSLELVVIFECEKAWIASKATLTMLPTSFPNLRSPSNMLTYGWIHHYIIAVGKCRSVRISYVKIPFQYLLCVFLRIGRMLVSNH
jgi:hypothetical protein